MIDASCAGLFPLRSGTSDCLVLWDDISERWLTASDLRAQSMALAERLERGDKRLVFLLVQTRKECLVALLAAAAAGHAVALIDASLPSEHLDTLCVRYRPDIVAGMKECQWITRLIEQQDVWETSECSADALVLASRKASKPEMAIAADLLLLLSTSGTTGSSKFVRLSRTAVTVNAAQIAESLSLDPESVAIAHLPLHYSYGLSVVTSHFAAGGRIALVDDTVTSGSFWTKVDACQGTHFPGVPFHYSVLARLGLGVAPASISTFTQAGGHLDTRIQAMLLEKMTQRGARFFIMYGQTEAAPRMASLASGQMPAKLGSVGIAVPGGKLLVVDGEGRPLHAKEIGAVVYEGPNVMMGYAEKRDDLAAGDVLGGRLHTGDLGWLDTDGYLFLSGRIARFAKIAGLRLGLDDIEKQIFSIGPAACVEHDGRIIVIFEGEVPENAKATFKSMALAYKIPAGSFVVRSLPRIPRKANGKIDYASVRESVDV